MALNMDEADEGKSEAEVLRAKGGEGKLLMGAIDWEDLPGSYHAIITIRRDGYNSALLDVGYRWEE